MKTLFLALLCFVAGSGCSPGTAQDRPKSPLPTPAPVVTNPPPTAPAATVPAAASTTPAPAPAPATAPLPPPPPELPQPAQEVVRLTQSSLGPSVITHYIESIQTPFTLTADQLIYLSDLGIGEPIINALLRKASSPAPAPATAVAPPSANTNPVAIAAPPTVPTSNPPLALQGIPGAPPPSPSAPVYGPGQPVAPAPAPAPAPAAPVVVAPPQAPVGYATFYESLSPYGNWVQIEPYGWCWQPSVVVVNNTWRPYCDGGQWMWTDYGWYWQSTYSWGWAPFHYGRWHRSARVGWVWSPGSDWGPAWVSWRQSDLYCGWAPLPPECRWSSSVGFSWYSGGTAVSIGFGLSTDYWYACSWNRFRDPGLHRWGIERHHVNQFVGNSRMAVGGDHSVNIVGNNNTVIVNDGIPRDQVQRHTREEIRKHSVVDAATPGISSRAAGGSAAARPEIAVYRPPISRPTDASPTPPASILGRQEARKASGSPSASGFTANPGVSAVPTRPSALNPVPPVLGASAPAVSRPGPTPTTPGSSPATPSIPTRPAPSVRPAPFAGPSTAPTTPSTPARPPVTLQPTRPPSGSPSPNAGVTPPRTDPAPTPALPTRPSVSSPAPRPPDSTGQRIEVVSPRAGSTPTSRTGTPTPTPNTGRTAYPGSTFGQPPSAPPQAERPRLDPTPPRFPTPAPNIPVRPTPFPSTPTPTVPSVRPDFPSRSFPANPPAHFSPPAHNPVYSPPSPRPMPTPTPSMPPGRNFTPSTPSAPSTPHPGSAHPAPTRGRSPDR